MTSEKISGLMGNINENAKATEKAAASHPMSSKFRKYREATPEEEIRMKIDHQYYDVFITGDLSKLEYLSDEEKEQFNFSIAKYIEIKERIDLMKERAFRAPPESFNQEIYCTYKNLEKNYERMKEGLDDWFYSVCSIVVAEINRKKENASD